MTTTPSDPTDTDAPAAMAPSDAPTNRVAAHPDNPRRQLGDLSELVRSMKAHGVLQPLLVLPADEHGVHLIVAGHRRHAAAVEAGLDRVPIVVRDLDRAAVIEAMLVENTSRDDLSPSDEVAAIAKLITLDGALTPAKLCKRIGKSQRWVRDRMTITVLPARWIDAITEGQLTLAQAVAAAGAADLGPDHVEGLCDELAHSGGWNREPARTVDAYRRRVKLDAEEAEAIARCQQTNVACFTRDNPPPNSARSLSQLGLDDRARGPHSSEPCHAIYVQRESWSDRIKATAYCTNPKRHQQPKGDRPAASPIVVDRPRRDSHDDSHAKRRARLARLAAATETFAKRRGAPSSSELMVMALHSFIDHASHDAATFAATILGLDGANPRQALAAHAATGASGLAQAAGAVACGTAEAEAYHSTRHGVIAWYQLLIDHGWQPDDWTQTQLAHAASRDAAEQQTDTHSDNPQHDESEHDGQGDDAPPDDAA